jgi:hypothetical protein
MTSMAETVADALTTQINQHARLVAVQNDCRIFVWGNSGPLAEIELTDAGICIDPLSAEMLLTAWSDVDIGHIVARIVALYRASLHRGQL